MRTIEKALAYITQGNNLLVFSQIGAPEAGIQVPGGSLNPDEKPEVAVIREAEEETGLHGFSSLAYLGIHDHDYRPWGRDEIHRRYFYHLPYHQPTPETWTHSEPDPSVKGEILFPFNFIWVEMPNNVPELIGERGIYLEMLYKNMKLINLDN